MHLWRTSISTDAKESPDREKACLSKPVTAGCFSSAAEQLHMFRYRPRCIFSSSGFLPNVSDSKTCGQHISVSCEVGPGCILLLKYVPAVVLSFLKHFYFITNRLFPFSAYYYRRSWKNNTHLP